MVERLVGNQDCDVVKVVSHRTGDGLALPQVARVSDTELDLLTAVDGDGTTPPTM